MKKIELEAKLKELQNLSDVYHRAYDNVIIIQESIILAIKEVKKEKKKAIKDGEEIEAARWNGYLQCLYAMSSWVDMHDNRDIDETVKKHGKLYKRGRTCKTTK